MTLTQVNPHHTYALVVGIEQYDGGWKLDGPASDARRFVDWLLQRGVPSDNIGLFLAPLDVNQDLVNQSGPIVHPAISGEVEQFVTRTLAQQEGQLLFVFWGGHGLFTVDDGRKLLYANANDNDKVSLDLKSFLDCLRSETLRGFPLQICIVDACAQYIDDRDRRSIRESKLPRGDFVKECKQFVLLAASDGELAKNITVRKSGAFSEVVQKELSQAPTNVWPPDMDGITRRLLEHFEILRKQGDIKQTPISWIRTVAGSEQIFDWVGDRDQRQRDRAALPTTHPGQISKDEQKELVNLLLESSAMSNDANRDAVLESMPSNITTRISRNRMMRIDVMNIVRTCTNYAGGIEALVAAVCDIDDGLTGQDLDAWLKRTITSS